MSKGKGRRGRPAGARRQSQRPRNKPSLLIPIIVGVVVVAIGVAALGSLVRQRTTAGSTSGSGTDSGSVATAQAQFTQSIPYPLVQRAPLDEVKAKLDQGQAVLVDVRSKTSYDEAHAVGALSIPADEIEARIGELPHDKDIILYCS